MFPLRKGGMWRGEGVLCVCGGCIVWGTGSVGKGFYRGWGQFRGGIVVKRSATERSGAGSRDSALCPGWTRSEAKPPAGDGGEAACILIKRVISEKERAIERKRKMKRETDRERDEGRVKRKRERGGK